MKNVALGSGFAMVAIWNMRVAREELKLRAEPKALTVTSLVIFFPS